MGASMSLSLLTLAVFMTDFWIFYAIYTVAFGLVQGWCYLITFHHTWLWFPNNKGLVSGICMAGLGLGGTVFNSIMTPIVNPTNAKFKPECYPGANYGCYPAYVDDNFKEMMFTIIAVFAGIVLIGMLTIFKGPRRNEG